MIPLWLPTAAVSGLLTVGATRLALSYLIRKRILDQPNHRSSHKIPTPRGGGLGVVPAVALVWAGLAVSGGPFAPWAGVLVVGALLLMALSWADDRWTLPAGPRLLVHAGMVTGALALLPPDALAFSGRLPEWADHLLVGLGWLWFINLYNFMDGIDGISGVETASVAAGAGLVAALAGDGGGLSPFAAALAGAGAGFLVWNWHPARVFLGDVGSVPLGFLLGGLLLRLAASGHLAAALILPAYYLADATLTLARRALDGEKVWQAHRRHFYQRAVQGGKRHNQVATAILAGNLALAAAAALTITRPAAGTAAAALVVAGMLAVLQRWALGGTR